MVHDDLRKKLREIIFANRRSSPALKHESFERNIEDYLQAEEQKTPYGSCLVRHDYYPDGYRHGVSDIYSLLNYQPSLVSKLTNNSSLSKRARKSLREHRNLNQIQIERHNNIYSKIKFHEYLFLDIEATGLSGGVGVYPFLIGIGFFGSQDFHIYQLFMRDYHEEQAVLYLLGKFIKDKRLKGLVTYNGKAYDVNVLNTRRIVSGIELPVSDMPNFDLLYPVRKLFKKRIGDCSLTSIEREILNFYRVDDIPGYKVPEVYFDFVRRGFSEPMRKVFIHNLYDVLSMVAIAERLCSFYSDPIELVSEPEDLFQIAALYEINGSFKDAKKIYSYLSSCQGSFNYKAKMAMSFRLKKERNLEEASGIWKECISNHPKISIVPYIELAKYYEHQIKDYRNALLYTQKGLYLANLFCLSHSNSYEFDKRIQRLNKKILKLENEKDHKDKESDDCRLG